MPKMTIRKQSGSAPEAGPVTVKRVRTPEGRTLDIFSVNAGSKTFASDLRRAFEKNVAKARAAQRKNLREAG